MKIPAVLAGLKRKSESLASTILDTANELNTDRYLAPKTILHLSSKIVETTKQKEETDRQIELIETAFVQAQNGIMEDAPE